MIHAALDTSIGSSLVVADDQRILCNQILPGNGRDSDRQLAPWIVSTMADLALDLTTIRRWTVGTGPGSFAGLRYGIALVKGFCAISGAAMRGVPSCLALAQAVVAAGHAVERIGVLHDARCGQLILACFRRLPDGALQLQQDAVVLSPEELIDATHRCDYYVSAQLELLPTLPEDVMTRFLACVHLDVRTLLFAPEQHWPWPQNPQDILSSCEPLYVRPPVFVTPQPVRATSR